MSNHVAPGPAKRRKDLVYGLAVLLGVLILGWVVVTMQRLADDLHTSNAARDALAQQVQQLGASPVAGPPGSRGVPGPAVTGPSGPPGERGEPGSPGAAASPVPGPSGATGPQGVPGADSTVPGPQGPQGDPGADSTVPGPKGDQGDPGVAGHDGKDGADGRDGTAGSPPAGWTYTDPLGQAYTCSPVDGFDPAAPRYSCTAYTTPPASPARSGLLGVGLLAGTATYRRL